MSSGEKSNRPRLVAVAAQQRRLDALRAAQLVNIRAAQQAAERRAAEGRAAEGHAVEGTNQDAS